MTTFTIDNENNITAFAEFEDALNYRIGSTEGTFASEKELAKLTSESDRRVTRCGTPLPAGPFTTQAVKKSRTQDAVPEAGGPFRALTT